jgi:amino acid adenylation domain-containing protein
MLPSASGNPQLDIPLTNNAYIIYTSGTTGQPKGVPIRHESISNRIQYHVDFMGLSSKDNFLHFAALNFDASLVEIGMAFISGSTLAIADQSLKSNTDLLIEMMEKERVTTAIFPPAFLKVLDRHPLPSLQHIISTGEAAALEETLFYAKTKNFYNGYGPSETCIGATFHKVDISRADSYRQHKGIPIGIPFANTRVFVLDQQQRLVPRGMNGEVCVAGIGVAKGYLHQAALSKEKFLPNPFQTDPNTPTLYRTGDLGCWNEEGELEFLGRIDEQVQIRGIRVETKEIESWLRKHADIKDALVLPFTHEHHGTYLVAYLSTDRPEVSREARNYLLSYLPEYMIPSYFEAMTQFPLSTSGKVDRKQLPAIDEQLLNNKGNHVAPSLPEEIKMAQIWEEILGKEPIGLKDNFFDIGGHSLKATKLVSKIYRVFNRKIDLNDVFDLPSIEALLPFVLETDNQNYQAIPAVEEQAYYEASPSQKRTWILTQFEGASTVYNVPGAFRLEGNLNESALIESIEKMVERHEILRTTFVTIDGELKQKVNPYQPGRVDIQQLDLSAKPDKEKELESILNKESQIEIDLEQGPLFRVKLIKMAAEETVFLYTLHHIIADGWSIQVLFKEVAQLYNAISSNQTASLPALKIQHKDYTYWLKDQLENDKLNNHQKYWLGQFADDIPVLDFPTDYPRPAVKTYVGSSQHFIISESLTKKLRSLASQHDLSMFMLLMSAIKVLLMRYTEQEDLVVGTLISGREHPELENQIGFYGNTLPIRTQIGPSDTIGALLDRVRTNVLGAFKHGAYPFDYLIDQLPVNRDISRAPLFDVLLTHLNVGLFGDEASKMNALELSSLSTGDALSTRFDLELVFTEYENEMSGNLTFNTDLFRPDTIERFASHLIKVLEAIPEGLNLPLYDIHLLEDKEEELLVQFNNTYRPLPEGQTFIDCFEAQVERSPQQVAVQCEDRYYTYEDVNRCANQIAQWLQQSCPFEKEEVVGLCLERSEWLVIGIIAILKSGATYLPIDPELPKERIDYILSKANAKTVLTDRGMPKKLSAIPSLDMVTHKDKWSAMPENNLATKPTPDQLAYILFTSGSTGLPKGAMIEHGSVLNHFSAKVRDFQLTAESKVAQTASHSFDISVWQALAGLMAGARTIVYPSDTVLNPADFINAVDYDETTVLQLVPSYLAKLLDTIDTYHLQQRFSHLHCFCSVGETLPPALLERWTSKFPFARVLNAFGPTEAADGVTHYTIDSRRKYGTVPIGKPIQNSRIYILDQGKNPCPIGAKGEMYIAGRGVGRGYIDDAEKTAAAFFEDPFMPGERMYKTGDIGRWLPNGILEFFGRKDNQVKVRGYRIELTEIEQNLYRLPQVKEAAVILRADNDNINYLCAYLSLKEGCTANIKDIRSGLAELLPAYMTPTRIIILDQLPKTSSGKVDRKQLPEPTRISTSEATKTVLEPQTETERILLDIWKEVLDLNTISTDGNFFEIGGHSFKAIKMQAQLFKKANIGLSIKEIFMYPSIQSLASHIDATFKVEELAG